MRFGTPGTTAKRLFDLEIDEVSSVDRPANQHGRIAFSKRAEDDMPELYDLATGEPVDEDALEHGQKVQDADGNVYAFFEPGTPEYDQLAAEVDDATGGVDLDQNDNADDREPALVGKRHSGRGKDEKSFGQQIFEDLSKALTDSDRDEVIAKAMDAYETLEKRYDSLEDVVKNLIDERDEEGFTQLASTYQLPVNPAQLGGVLKRAAATLDPEDVQLLDRIFTSVGEQLYVEKGLSGPGAESDVLDQVYALVNETVGKSDLTEAQAMTAIFETNTDAYDAYLAESGQMH